MVTGGIRSKWRVWHLEGWWGGKTAVSQCGVPPRCLCPWSRRGFHVCASTLWRPQLSRQLIKLWLESQSIWHCHLCGGTLVKVTSLSKEDIKATLKGDADKNGGKRAFHYRRLCLLPGRISVMPRNQFMAGEVWVCGHCPLSRVRWSVWTKTLRDQITVAWIFTCAWPTSKLTVEGKLIGSTNCIKSLRDMCPKSGTIGSTAGLWLVEKA